MKASQSFLATLKEAPSDAEVVSHKLMVRAGLIRKLSAGIYNYLPLGLKSIRKVENIIREEMNRAGAIELLMPMVQPAELWQETGRWEKMGPELLRIKDRHDRDFLIQPTSEEVVTDLARNEIKSFKQRPVNFYQIQTKFRDERRQLTRVFFGRVRLPPVIFLLPAFPLPLLEDKLLGKLPFNVPSNTSIGLNPHRVVKSLQEGLNIAFHFLLVKLNKLVGQSVPVEFGFHILLFPAHIITEFGTPFVKGGNKLRYIAKLFEDILREALEPIVFVFKHIIQQLGRFLVLENGGLLSNSLHQSANQPDFVFLCVVG